VREVEEAERPKVVNLDVLVERSGRANEFSRYLVLIKDHVFDLDKTGFQISQNCAGLLTVSN
jgi:hypothetical protein